MSDRYFGNQQASAANQYQSLQSPAPGTMPKLTHAQELENKASDLRSGILDIRSRLGSLANRLGVQLPVPAEKVGDTPIPPGVLTSIGFTIQGSQNHVGDIFQLLNEIEQRI